MIIYLRQEGRGIGLLDKLRAYNLQDIGYDTVEANLALGHHADERDYTVAALILTDLGVGTVRLITNNPSKIEHLAESGCGGHRAYSAGIDCLCRQRPIPVHQSPAHEPPVQSGCFSNGYAEPQEWFRLKNW